MIYRNDSGITLVQNGIVFTPNDLIKTDKICDSTDLTLISWEGSYNPVVAVHDVTFANGTTVYKIEIDYEKTASLRIWKGTVAFKVWVNDETNLPYIPINANETYDDLEGRGKIQYLYIQGSAAGSCQIVEWAAKSFK